MHAGLDPAQLSALPKIDFQRSVLEYVKHQTLFRKDYAKEGQAYTTTWGSQEDICTKELPQPSVAAFATPVLKPRVVRLVRKAEKQHDVKDTSHQGTEIRKHDSDKQGESKKEACSVDTPVPKGRTRSKNKAKPKRAVERHTDEETRLRERRERKRAKKAIMESDKENCAKPRENESKSKSVSKKIKLPAGLALMHGFTATNVGRHRLTIDPPLRLGVFSKGKASTQTRVGKKKDTRAKGFSEEKFLNPKQKSKRNGNTHSTSSASLSDGDSVTSSDIQDPDNEVESPTCHPIKKVANSSRSSDGSELREPTRARKTKTSRKRKTTPKPQEPVKESSQPSKADSIVWDIEKEDGVLPPDSSLKSYKPKPSTVLVDVTQTKWCQNTEQRQEGILHKADTFQSRPALPSEDHTASVVSLCPSESLSQKVPDLFLETDKAKCVFQESKYFKSQEPPERKPPEEQDNLHHQITGNLPVSSPSPGYPKLICEDIVIGVDSHASESPTLGSLAPYFDGNDIAGEMRYHIRSGAQDWLFSDSAAANSFISGCEDESFPGVVYVERPLEPNGNELESHLAASHLDVDNNPTLNLNQTPDHDIECDTQIYDITYMKTSPSPAQPFDLGDCNKGYLPTFSEEHYSEGDHYAMHNQSTCNRGTLSDISSLLSQDVESVYNNPQSQSPTLLGRMPFSEGRNLLYGQTPLPYKDLSQHTLDSIEADVAKKLVSHWFPQKY